MSCTSVYDRQSEILVRYFIERAIFQNVCRKNAKRSKKQYKCAEYVSSQAEFLGDVT